MQLQFGLFEMCVADSDEKAKRDAGKWWKPWVSKPGGEKLNELNWKQCPGLPERCSLWLSSRHSEIIWTLFHAVENNCGYHLFESDSDEDEEEAAEKKEEEPPKKKSAFQVNDRDTLSVFFYTLLNVCVHVLCSCNIIIIIIFLSLVSQLAYNAWVTSSKSALKDLKKEKKKRKKEEKKIEKRELQMQQGECWFIIISSLFFFFQNLKLERTKSVNILSNRFKVSIISSKDRSFW